MNETPNITYNELQQRIIELEAELSFYKKAYESNTNYFKPDFLKNILNAKPYIYVVKDINSVYINANQSFCDFLGKTEEEIIGKTDYDFFPAEAAAEYIKGDKQVMAGEIHEKEEWEVLGSHGLKWLKVDKTPIYSETGDQKPIGVLCSVTDISHQKNTERSLLESKKKYKELNVMKDKYFSIIGHDLRTPISNIIGFTELSIDNIENNKFDKIANYLKIILSSANKSFMLLSDLLEWSRSQSNKIQIHKESIHVNKIIASAIDLSSEKIDEKKLQYSLNCNEELFVNSDKYILSTVIRNLVSNAIKFSNTGGSIKISCSKISIDEITKGVEIVVKDTGVGMSLDTLNTLFKIDKTVSTKGTIGEMGTGIGLILCKEFLEKIEGEIKVESEVNKGSVFKVLLKDE